MALDKVNHNYSDPLKISGAIVDGTLTVSGNPITTSALAQSTEPSAPTAGLVWVNTSGSASNAQRLRWKKTPSTGTAVLSGSNDSGNLTLSYTPGFEQVYLNGSLLVMGVDYTATDGTSITLTQSTNSGDIIEIVSVSAVGLTNVYTQAQSDARYLSVSAVTSTLSNPIFLLMGA